MEKQMAGYPSIDKPWLKYYREGAERAGFEFPKGKRIWELYKETLIKQGDEVPAIQYFGRSISRSEFISLVEQWEKVFRVMNVKPDEIVVLFGPALTEFAEMFMALNAIGAIPYFLKIDSEEADLKKESKEARIAVVLEDMWDTVSNVFTQEHFDFVIVISATDSMPFPLKKIVRGIKAIKGKSFPFQKYTRCISVDQALKKAEQFSGILQCEPFKENQIAAITVSSGTTASGTKGIMDTNESILASIFAMTAAEGRFIKGRKVLVELPFMASTSLNCLFLMPLFSNMTMIIEPRMSAETWFDHIVKYKPAATITTGAYWDIFFQEVEKRKNKGKSIDLSFADGFTMGGSGTSMEKLQWMNNLLRECGSSTPMINGYGLSEVFGVMATQKLEAHSEHRPERCPVNDVGLPLPGFVVSIHDAEGNELKYGERGELWVSSPTVMHGYYNKPELTADTLINGQIHTGDLCSIDEDGFVYVYGRIKNKVEIDGKTSYLFDIADNVRMQFSLAECMVEKKEMEDGSIELVMYIAQWKDQVVNEELLINRINDFYSGKYQIVGYKVYLTALPANPATLKPRTNDLNGFINYKDGKRIEIAYQKFTNGKHRRSPI